MGEDEQKEQFPSDERQAWRCRFAIECYADLPQEFSIGDLIARAYQGEELHSGRAVWMVDVFLPELTLEDAFFLGFDVSNELADAVAYLSFAPVRAYLISVTVPNAGPDSPFRILVPTEGFWRTRVPLDREQIQLATRNLDKPIAEALRKFRTGISASSPYQAITDCWIALETLARSKTQKAPPREICKKCSRPMEEKKDPIIDGWFSATKNAQKSVEDAHKARKGTYLLRNILSHGGKLHDRNLREEAVERRTWLQASAAFAIEETSGIPVVLGHAAHLEMPYLVLEAEFKIVNSEIGVISRIIEYKASTMIAMVPSNTASPPPGDFFFGIRNFNRPIEVFELPEFRNSENAKT